MPGGAQVIGGYQRAKTGGQGNAAIVGGADRRRRRECCPRYNPSKCKAVQAIHKGTFSHTRVDRSAVFYQRHK
jgi:hypothetical protein